jgi:phosphotransferase system enzyme I (PtsI)
MNEKLSDYYQTLHPAVLFLVKPVIEVSHRYKKFTGMCGELAGDSVAMMTLLSFGLAEFSMSSSAMLTEIYIIFPIA